MKKGTLLKALSDEWKVKAVDLLQMDELLAKVAAALKGDAVPR
jgi:hypothetical protein